MKTILALSLFIPLIPAFAETHLLIKTRVSIPGAKRMVGSTQWQTLRVSETEKQSVIRALQKDERVEWVEEDQVYHVDQASGPIEVNDALYSKLWAIRKMGVDTAWSLVPANAKEVLVAVVDTGMAVDHPDLKQQLYVNSGEARGNGLDDDHNGFIDDVNGWNFEAKDSEVEDDFNHGTHVSGIIGATPNNQIGVTGVGPKVRVLPVRWMKNGSGWGEDAIAAIRYAVKMGARVINASWGGIGYSKALEEAVREAEAQGVLFVASAGNGHADNDVKPHHPGNLRMSNVVTVASVDENDRLEKYSNYGLKNVELGAPGKNILSTTLHGNYAEMSGTSMAAAEVSGVAALLLAINPNLRAPDLKRIMMQSVVPSSDLQGKTVSGGRVDALAAAKLVVREMIQSEKGPVADDSDLGGASAEATVYRMKSGNLLKPDSIEDGDDKAGLHVRFVRTVNGVETPVEGIAFKAQIHTDGTYQSLKSDSAGMIVDPVCGKASISVTASLEAPRYQVTPGSAPYDLLLKLKCGMEQKVVFQESSEAGEAMGVWQIATKAERKIANEMGLSFWKRQIAFEWPSKGDYYDGDRVHLTFGHQWDVVSHEMGHAIYDQGGVGVFGGGQHYIDQCYTEALSLSEGWASFYAGWLNIDLKDADARFQYMVPRRAPIRFENIPSDVCGKSTNEWRVIGFFWDLIDLHDDGETQAESFKRLWADTAGARASSPLKIKESLIRKGWDRDRLENIWKLNFPND